MSLLLSDLKWMKCANPPTDYDTTGVGGAISATQILGSSVGEVFFSTVPNDTGGGPRTQYNKVFALNDSATDDAVACAFWLLSCIDDVTGSDTITASSSSSSDNTTYKIRIIGFDGVGDPVQAERTLNGISAVTTGATFSVVTRIELRTTSGPLTTANGNITILFGSLEIAVLLAGQTSLTNEVSWGRAATLDDTGTTTDTITPPGGITFLKNRTAGTAFGAVGADIPSGSAQGIWMMLQVEERAKMSAEVQHGMRFRANASS